MIGGIVVMKGFDCFEKECMENLVVVIGIKGLMLE